jgi:dienelactone hydrolase
MPAVLARSVYLAAAVVLAASLMAIRISTRDASRYPTTLPGGIPAVIYEPGPPRSLDAPIPEGRRLPVFVLAHGFSGNKGEMATLGLRLARAGFAVITFDFRGHGWNPAPFGYGSPREALYEDVEAAVRYASSRPDFDVERLVLAGHSMGGGAVLGYASHEAGAAAVVDISGVGSPDGPYPVPNALLIWASGDPRFIREHQRKVGAELAGLERLVLDRTYGEPRRGSAVRISEVEGANHLTILYSEEAARRIVSWLNEVLVPGPKEAASPRSDGRVAWVLLGLVSAGVLLFGAPRLLAPIFPGRSRDLPGPLRTTLFQLGACHAAALLVLSGVDPQAGGGPFGATPIVGGAELLTFLFLSGVLLCGFALVRGRAASPQLPTGGEIFASGALAVAGYVLLVAVVFPLWDLRIAPHRMVWAGAGALLSLPFYLGTEWTLRGDGREHRWHSPLGKVLTLLFVLGGTLLGLLPDVVLMALGAVIVLFVLFELVGVQLARARAGPWVPALVQAAWTGWLIGALLPIAT